MQPFHIVTPSKDGDKTVIVIGAFRGGTSMIAGVVDALGIPMIGNIKAVNPDYDNWEDKEIQDILHGKYPVELLTDGCFPRTESRLQPDLVEHQRAADIVADFQRKAEGEFAKFRSVVGKRNQVGSWGWK